MDIDWDQPALLTCTPMLNVPYTAMPDFSGSLRECVIRASDWPTDSHPAIWLDTPLAPGGRSVLDSGEIYRLRRQL